MKVFHFIITGLLVLCISRATICGPIRRRYMRDVADMNEVRSKGSELSTHHLQQTTNVFMSDMNNIDNYKNANNIQYTDHVVPNLKSNSLTVLPKMVKNNNIIQEKENTDTVRSRLKGIRETDRGALSEDTTTNILIKHDTHKKITNTNLSKQNFVTENPNLISVTIIPLKKRRDTNVPNIDTLARVKPKSFANRRRIKVNPLIMDNDYMYYYDYEDELTSLIDYAYEQVFIGNINNTSNHPAIETNKKEHNVEILADKPETNKSTSPPVKVIKPIISTTTPSIQPNANSISATEIMLQQTTTLAPTKISKSLESTSAVSSSTPIISMKVTTAWPFRYTTLFPKPRRELRVLNIHSRSKTPAHISHLEKKIVSDEVTLPTTIINIIRDKLRASLHARNNASLKLSSLFLSKRVLPIISSTTIAEPKLETESLTPELKSTTKMVVTSLPINSIPTISHISSDLIVPVDFMNTEIDVSNTEVLTTQNPLTQIPSTRIPISTTQIPKTQIPSHQIPIELNTNSEFFHEHSVHVTVNDMSLNNSYNQIIAHGTNVTNITNPKLKLLTEIGIAPSGTDPEGIAPSGIAPFGLIPEGLKPFGISPEGKLPLGAHLSSSTIKISNLTSVPINNEQMDYNVTSSVNQSRISSSVPKSPVLADEPSSNGGFVVGERYHMQVKGPNGLINGDYVIVNKETGSFNGVRYEAVEDADPRLIQEALVNFLSFDPDLDPRSFIAAPPT